MLVARTSFRYHAASVPMAPWAAGEPTMRFVDIIRGLRRRDGKNGDLDRSKPGPHFLILRDPTAKLPAISFSDQGFGVLSGSSSRCICTMK